MSTQKQRVDDKFSQYLQFRTEYVEQLREKDLLDVGGSLRAEVLDGLFGDSRFIPVEGSPMDEHCREHPEDPICMVISTGDLAEQFLDIRGGFLDKIEEHDLRSVQEFVMDVTRKGSAAFATDVGQIGLVTPDQDIDDIPPWLRPFVNPGGRFEGSPVPMPFDRIDPGRVAATGGGGSVGLVGPDQNIEDIPWWLRPYVNPGLIGRLERTPSLKSVSAGTELLY